MRICRVDQKQTIQRNWQHWLHKTQEQINVTEYVGSIKNEQSRETGNIGYTRRIQTKQKHNTKYVGHHCTQTNQSVIGVLTQKEQGHVIPFEMYTF